MSQATNHRPFGEKPNLRDLQRIVDLIKNNPGGCHLDMLAEADPVIDSPARIIAGAVHNSFEDGARVSAKKMAATILPTGYDQDGWRDRNATWFDLVTMVEKWLAWRQDMLDNMLTLDQVKQVLAAIPCEVPYQPGAAQRLKDVATELQRVEKEVEASTPNPDLKEQLELMRQRDELKPGTAARNAVIEKLKPLMERMSARRDQVKNHPDVKAAQAEFDAVNNPMEPACEVLVRLRTAHWGLDYVLPDKEERQLDGGTTAAWMDWWGVPEDEREIATREISDHIEADCEGKYPKGDLLQYLSTEPTGGSIPSGIIAQFTAGAILDMKLPPQDHLFAGGMSTIDAYQLVAPRGEGKTLFAMGMAAAAAAGADFAGWESTGPRKVLYLDGELPTEESQFRLDKIISSYPKKEQKLIRSNLVLVGRELLTQLMRAQKDPDWSFPMLDTDRGLDLLDGLLEATQAQLVFMDSRYCLLSTSMMQVDSLPSDLVFRIRQRKVGQVWIHHTGKDVSRGGYGDITAEFALDTTVHLCRKGEQWKLSFGKTRKRNEENAHFYAERNLTFDGGAWSLATKKDEKASKEASAKKALAQDPAISERDLAELLQCSPATAHRLKKKLLD